MDKEETTLFAPDDNKGIVKVLIGDDKRFWRVEFAEIAARCDGHGEFMGQNRLLATESRQN